MDAIILAAGTGSRMRAGQNKAFMKILGKEMLLYTVDAFVKSRLTENIIVVTGEEDIERCKNLLEGSLKPVTVIKGGSTRQESSYIGVLAAKSDVVIIHDGARPLVLPEDIDEAAKMAEKFGGAAVGFPCIDTMKRCEGTSIVETVDREGLYKIYTPQCFNRKRLSELHGMAKEKGVIVTDDCALYEWGGEDIKIVVGSSLNIKLTTPEDVYIAEAILQKRGN